MLEDFSFMYCPQQFNGTKLICSLQELGKFVKLDTRMFQEIPEDCMVTCEIYMEKVHPGIGLVECVCV